MVVIHNTTCSGHTIPTPTLPPQAATHLRKDLVEAVGMIDRLVPSLKPKKRVGAENRPKLPQKETT